MPKRRKRPKELVKRAALIYAPPPILAIIRRLRLERGISQAKLARRAGISLATYARMETGWRQKPRWSTVAALLDGLGVSLDAARVAERKLIERLTEKGRIVWIDDQPRVIRDEYAPMVQVAMKEAERTGQYWRNVLDEMILQQMGAESGAGSVGGRGEDSLGPGAELSSEGRSTT